MKTIATLVLVAPLLFTGCSPTETNKAPASASIKPAAASPKQFWFDYQFEPSPGKRNWKMVDKDTWTEEYPNGEVSRFKIIGRETVRENSGTVVSKISGNGLTANDGGFQVFIPDVGSSQMRLLFRNKISGEWEPWKSLDLMHGVE